MKALNYKPAQWVWYSMVKIMPQTCAKIIYRKALGRSLDLENPKDLNEKINYLKFHADMNEWALLADKYAVRRYVEERGLSKILPKLYGKFNTVDELMCDWNNLPQQFVLKTNNGCGTVRIVEDKDTIITEEVKKQVNGWLQTKRVGLGTVEPHYMLITPCVIVEELLHSGANDISRSLIDYKIWCFNGNPYCILACFNRDIEHHTKSMDIYSLDWKKRDGVIFRQNSDVVLDKPKNLEEMLDIAAKLSNGHPQMRVDLYNIDGQIYFGELTMTAACGYMDSYSPDFLLELGNQFSVK